MLETSQELETDSTCKRRVAKTESFHALKEFKLIFQLFLCNLAYPCSVAWPLRLLFQTKHKQPKKINLEYGNSDIYPKEPFFRHAKLKGNHPPAYNPFFHTVSIGVKYLFFSVSH